MWHPKHWPSWIGYGLLRLLCLLPVAWLTGLGAAVGRVFGRVVKSRRHVVETNLRLCFPDMDLAERSAMADAHFEAIGRGGFEAVLAWFAPDAKLRGLADVVGLEHLDAAQSEHGVLLLTGHFSCMELGARFLAMERPFHAMYRPLNNAVFDRVTTQARELRSQRDSLPRDDLKRLIRSLRNRGAIWYGPDQTLDISRNSAFVPFFGIATVTVTATSRLAQMGRAKVVPFYPRRLPDGRYRVEIHPALEDFPGDSPEADARRINASLEAAVRLAPEQYFWIHRRFKRRPRGEPGVY